MKDDLKKLNELKDDLKKLSELEIEKVFMKCLQEAAIKYENSGGTLTQFGEFILAKLVPYFRDAAEKAIEIPKGEE